MCDITKPLPPLPDVIDRELAEMKADWQSLARYTVYRSEGRHSKSARHPPLGENLTYDQAQNLRTKAEAALRLEPDYREYVMSRPLICLELERPEETQAAYRKLRATRAAAPAGAEIEAVAV